jgi:large subunit ribosomal protein L4
MTAARGSSKKGATAKPGEVPSWDGGQTATRTLDVTPLGQLVKKRLLSTAVRMYEANRRQGNASTKTRGETSYTTRKPYRQKGTGNARRGDFNSPLLRGGGVIFGPRPRDFGFQLPRRARREALRSALTGKLRDGEIRALSSSAFEKPSTKTAAAALSALGCQRSAVVVLPGDNATLWKSFRNIRGVSVVRASDLNAWQVLAHEHLLLVDDAWTVVLGRLPAVAEAS